jgi:hypothetical protein
MLKVIAPVAKAMVISSDPFALPLDPETIRVRATYLIPFFVSRKFQNVRAPSTPQRQITL